MPRPVGKTIHAEWWDDDESVTFRTVLTLLESQRLDELRLEVQTAFEAMRGDHDRAVTVANGLAELILLSVIPGKFHLHSPDSEPDVSGVKPWVACTVEGIRDLSLDDLFYISRRGEVAAATPDAGARAAGATFPVDGHERPSANGAGAQALQAAV